MRTYTYQIKQGPGNEPNKTIFHLYITAVPRFSLREVLAKQHWFMTHLLDLPFNKIELKLAGSRESRDIHIEIDIDILQKEIDKVVVLPTSVFHYDYVTLDKVSKTVSVDYENVIEIVLYENTQIQPVLDLVMSKWKGVWQKLEL